MTMPTALGNPPVPPCHHASVEEYTQFVYSYTTGPTYRCELLQRRKHFVERYPDLRDWFAAPLAERFESLGSAYAETGKHGSSKVFVHVHHYLKFLALRGYAPLDWDWLIALSPIYLEKMLEHPLFVSNVSMLVEEAITLGYEPPVAHQKLLWSVFRIFLHKGITQVEQITIGDLTEFTEALDRFGARPDVARFFGSEGYYSRRKGKRYLGSLQVLQNVLYSSSSIVALPRHVTKALL